MAALQNLIAILFWCAALICGQEDTCYECEDYLGNYCQCNRYDIYWNVDRRLYGISDCSGLTQVLIIL